VQIWAGKPIPQQAIFSGVIVMSFDANKNMITAAFVTQFHDSFEIAAQQKDSRLQAAVNDRGRLLARCAVGIPTK
jgi:hypothetical protein